MSFRSVLFVVPALVLLPPMATTRAETTPELPSSREEVATALARVGEKYGIDAVRLQSHLLQNSLQAGSQLAAGTGVVGIEEHEGRAFLVLSLETGIVYNDADTEPASHPRSIWSGVVEPTLREFRTLTVPAAGIALKVSYQHGAYDDEDELLRLLASHPPQTEELVFYLATTDILEMAHSRITASELLARCEVTLAGRPVRIELPRREPKTPATAPPTPLFQLFPETPDG